MAKRTVIRQYPGSQRSALRVPYDWQAREVEPIVDPDGVQVTGKYAFDLNLWGEEQEIDISYVQEIWVTEDLATGQLDAFLLRHARDDDGKLIVDRDSGMQGGMLVSLYWDHHRVSSVDLLLAQFDLTRTRVPEDYLLHATAQTVEV